MYEKNLVRYISQQRNYLIWSLFNSINYSFLIENILSMEHLYGSEFYSCFNFIRRMTDLVKYNYYLGLPKSTIDFNFSRIFPCSRRLMIAVCFDELIWKSFYSEMSKADLLKHCKVEGDPSSELKVFITPIEKQYKERQVIFKKKGSGVNPGYIMDRDDDNRFFIKMFHLASYKKRKGSKDQESEYGTRTYVSNSLSFQASLRSSATSGTSVEEFKLNLLEPFIYTVLDNLGIGAEFNLVINPYVNQGVYIATKDVSSNDASFLTFKEIENKKLPNEILFDENVVLSINELDFIGKLLGLRDLHCENFGFLLCGDILQYDSLKIIDFVYPNSEFESRDILSSFLNREITGLNIAEDTLIGKIIRKESSETILPKVFAKLNKRVHRALQNLSDTSKYENPCCEFKTLLSLNLANINDKLITERGNLPEEHMLSWETQLRTNAELIGFMKEGKHTYQFAYDNLQSYIDVLNKNYMNINNYINHNK